MMLRILGINRKTCIFDAIEQSVRNSLAVRKGLASMNE
jgi:hypothetical protein